MQNINSSNRYLVVLVLLATSCAPSALRSVPKKDKQAVGTYYGGALGAGAGAITGAQIGTVGAGPGAWVGLGLGATYGLISGIAFDELERDSYQRYVEREKLREQIWVQEELAEHYARRMELHPNREIFPADLFFDGDSASFKERGSSLARGVAKLVKEQSPWSRIAIASYVSSKDANSEFAYYLSERRAERLARTFVQMGIEPRRIEARPVILDSAILIDPYDDPYRYNQAIEIIYLDK